MSRLSAVGISGIHAREDVKNDLYEDGLLLTLFSDQGELLFSDAESSVKDFTAFKIPTSGKNTAKNSVKLTEFTGEEAFAFASLYQNIRAATQIKTLSPDRLNAVEWLFVPNTEDCNGLTFELCCAAFSAREGLLRIRTHYEFYSNNIILRLPFLASSIPDSIDLEAAGIGGEAGQDIVSLLWQNPGIRADHFETFFSNIKNSEFQRLTLDMECNGLIAMKNGCWYFTGRNPLIMRFGSEFDWTKIPCFE